MLSDGEEKQTILIVENIEKLYVEKLELAKSDEGRVSNQANSTLILLYVNDLTNTISHDL